MALPPSARGLFRATGNPDKPVVRATADGFEKVIGGIERKADEFYPTPPEPIDAIIQAELPRLRQFPGIWEAAAGDGVIRRHLEAAGLATYGSDLKQRGGSDVVQSWYDYRTPPYPAMLTNPPWADCNTDPGWIRHGMEVLGLDYMALMLPANWLGAAGRSLLWEQHRPARVYIIRWRVDFTGQGASPMMTIWVVWDRAYTGPDPLLLMLDRVDTKQGGLF